MALTGHPEVAAAAMLTAALPDQIEALLPFGRHRGASHWVMLWLALTIAVPFFLQGNAPLRANSLFLYHHGWNLSRVLVGMLAYGMALGPFLHVLLDGCSDAGVPVAPFSRRKLKLGIYRTYSHRWRWDLSELLFLGAVVAICVFAWRIQKPLPNVPW